MGRNKWGKEGLRCPMHQSQEGKELCFLSVRGGWDWVKDKLCTMFTPQSSVIGNLCSLLILNERIGKVPLNLR